MQAHIAAAGKGISFVMDGTFNREFGDYTLITFGTLSLAQTEAFLALYKLLEDPYATVYSMGSFGLVTTKSKNVVAYL